MERRIDAQSSLNGSMSLTAEDRGYLDKTIDALKSKAKENWAKFAGKTKSEWVWFEKGMLTGIFLTSFRADHKRPMNGEEMDEFKRVIEDGFSAIYDLITDLPDRK